MSPLVAQLIGVLIASGPQMLEAIAVIIKAVHGQPVSEADHSALGRALISALSPKPPSQG